MRRTKAFTLVELMVVIGIIGLLLAILVPALNKARETANRAVCMSNLNSINKALLVYKSENDNQFPWLFNEITSWDKTDVGKNYDKNPYKEGASKSMERSITTLMFMIVRSGQNADMFRCPSDKDSVKDDNPKNPEDSVDGDIEPGDYYWDFENPKNVSYSWQAPRSVDANYVNGIDGDESEQVIIGDMTPKYGGDETWKPLEIKEDSPPSDLQSQMSINHQREQVNVLYVAGNVKGVKRSDCGVSRDAIYTSYGDKFSDRRKGTDNLKDHKKVRDTYLIGPVGRIEP